MRFTSETFRVVTLGETFLFAQRVITFESKPAYNLPNDRFENSHEYKFSNTRQLVSGLREFLKIKLISTMIRTLIQLINLQSTLSQHTKSRDLKQLAPYQTPLNNLSINCSELYLRLESGDGRKIDESTSLNGQLARIL